MKNCIVAGGGFKGIMSAYLLAKAGHRVTLVEKAPFLGGIMHSREWNGFFIDNGVHVFDSVQKEVGDIVTDVMDGDVVPVSFNSASVYGDQVTHGFSLPDFSGISRQMQEKILFEVVERSAVGAADSHDNLHDRLTDFYGPTAAELMGSSLKHIYDIGPENLSPEALRQTSFHRLRFLPDAMALILKANPQLDDRLAAKRASLGKIDDFVSLYPGKRGMRGFCEKVLIKLQEMGIDIRLKDSLSDIQLTETGVQAKLKDDETITADHLIWASELPGLAEAWLGEDQISQHVYRTPMLLYAFQTHVDRIYDCTYFQHFTPGAYAYRSAAAGRYSHQIREDGSTFITCECPASIDSERWENAEANAPAVWQECIDIGLISGQEGFDDYNVLRAKVTHRMPKPGYGAACDALQEKVEATDSRIILPSRHAFNRREIFYTLTGLPEIVAGEKTSRHAA